MEFSSLVGQTLSHYRIIEKIGVGGMGEVYRAHDQRLERDVALKILHPGVLSDEPARKRFRKEALALSKLNHPNIATVHDFDVHEGLYFLIMEYVAGENLSERLHGGSLAETELLRLGIQLAEGLAAAHEQGIIHRDLKPSNTRLTSDGRLKILDFGLAKLLQSPTGTTETAETESIGETRGLVGTLPYMAPEQLRGEAIDGRTDIWSAGALLYKMATGRAAFPKADSARLITSILAAAPVPPRDLNRHLSPGVQNIILKCLEKNPEDRYQSAKELAVDFRRLLTPSTATHPILRPRSLVGKRMSLVAASSAALLLAFIVALNLGGVRDKLFAGKPHAQIRSLAVLPLANLSGDPNQEYFADGMTDVLITDLGQISALRVISRTSVMQYKGARKPLQEISRELNLDAVVEGSILRSASQVQITARLIEARTDTTIWSKRYERNLPEVLELQSDVAQAIADEIRVQLTPEEHARISTTRAVRPEVLDAYLSGRYYWEKRTEEGLKRSLEYFQKAIAIDPTYARAFAGLSDSYATLGNNRFLPPDKAFPDAEAAALKALSLDGNLAEAHASLAFAHWNYDFDWDVIDREYKRAIELNPGYATAYHWYSGYLSGIGSHREAIAAVKKARELDPLSPRINANVGFILYLARQYDASVEELQKAVKMDTSSGAPYLYLGMAYLQEGKTKKAIAALEENSRISDSSAADVLDLAYGYAVAGRREDSQKLLHGVMVEPHRTYTPALWIARAYLALGEKENAMRWLRKAYDERSPQLPFLNVDPRWDSLRSDLQFQDILRRMKLPPPSRILGRSGS